MRGHVLELVLDKHVASFDDRVETIVNGQIQLLPSKRGL
jgi:hypothetical protein